MPRKPTSPWEQLKHKSASLRRNLEQLTQDFLALSASENVDAVTGYNLGATETDAWKKTVDHILLSTEEALHAMQHRAADQAETLDARLSRVLRDAGSSLYGDSRLFIVDGIVHIETDPQNGTARINGELLSDLSVHQIHTRVVQEKERLKTLLTPPDKFLILLLQAYENELVQQKKDFGAQVRTGALLWQITLLKQQATFRSNPARENFRPYPRVLFRADLYRLLDADLTLVDGKRFRYASGSDTSGAVFTLIPQLGRTAHVGRIWFEH
jgi:hypothetical protein